MIPVTLFWGLPFFDNLVVLLDAFNDVVTSDSYICRDFFDLSRLCVFPYLGPVCLASPVHRFLAELPWSFYASVFFHCVAACPVVLAYWVPMRVCAYLLESCDPLLLAFWKADVELKMNRTLFSFLELTVCVRCL